MVTSHKMKKTLTKEFEIKDLRNPIYFIAMDVARLREDIYMSQRKYIIDLLTECEILECKQADTPMETTNKLGISRKGTPIDKGQYQRLVGKLIPYTHQVSIEVSS